MFEGKKKKQTGTNPICFHKPEACRLIRHRLYRVGNLSFATLAISGSRCHGRDSSYSRHHFPTKGYPLSTDPTFYNSYPYPPDTFPYHIEKYLAGTSGYKYSELPACLASLLAPRNVGKSILEGRWADAHFCFFNQIIKSFLILVCLEWKAGLLESIESHLPMFPTHFSFTPVLRYRDNNYSCE